MLTTSAPIGSGKDWSSAVDQFAQWLIIWLIIGDQCSMHIDSPETTRSKQSAWDTNLSRWSTPSAAGGNAELEMKLQSSAKLSTSLNMSIAWYIYVCVCKIFMYICICTFICERLTLLDLKWSKLWSKTVIHVYIIWSSSRTCDADIDAAEAPAAKAGLSRPSLTRCFGKPAGNQGATESQRLTVTNSHRQWKFSLQAVRNIQPAHDLYDGVLCPLIMTYEEQKIAKISHARLM